MTKRTELSRFQDPRLVDIHVANRKRAISPIKVAKSFPCLGQVADNIYDIRQQIAAVIARKSKKFIIYTGPCSTHFSVSNITKAGHKYDISGVCDFFSDVADLVHQKKISDKLITVGRIFPDKIRTSTDWPGSAWNPGMNGEWDVDGGILANRELMIKVARDFRIGTLMEFVNINLIDYFPDVIVQTSLGARTVGSSLHRYPLSALSANVMVKNTDDGRIPPAIAALYVILHSNTFMDGNRDIITSTGNPNCHLTLRGAQWEDGSYHPNYYPKQVEKAARLLREASMPEVIAIDCSHGNSKKDPFIQIKVLRSVMRQVQSGQQAIKMVLLESHIKAGSDKSGLDPHTSKTDGCIGIADTLEAIRFVADSLPKSFGS